jgi:hypothetical protein
MLLCGLQANHGPGRKEEREPLPRAYIVLCSFTYILKPLRPVEEKTFLISIFPLKTAGFLRFSHGFYRLPT